MKADSLFFALRTADRGRARPRPRRWRAVPGAGAVVRRDFAAGGLGLPLLRVDDPLRAAQDLAAHVRQKYRAVKYVGITGSAGKTTTKEFVYQILSQQVPLLPFAAELEQLDRPAFFAPADERPRSRRPSSSWP